MANSRIAFDALNRFASRRNEAKSKKIDELRALIKAMRGRGMPRGRASEAVIDMAITVNSEGIEWGELGIKEEELPALENAAVVCFLKGLIRRLRLEDHLSYDRVNAWCEMIIEEVACSGGSVTWDMLRTNGNELIMLAERATQR